jgi:tetratricopeptide (TPR) repeat protein
LTQFALGDAHKDESLLLLASGYFDKASKVRQDHPELWNNWGMTLMRLSDLFDSKEYIELAIEKFETALKHFKSTPPSTQLLYNYACALDFLGSYNEEITMSDIEQILYFKEGSNIISSENKLYPFYQPSENNREKGFQQFLAKTVKSDSRSKMSYEYLQKTKKNLIKMMAKNTGQSEAKIEKDVDRDFFMSADEAKKYGIVDKVLG